MRLNFKLTPLPPSFLNQLFEAVAPGLKLDAEGRATYEGIPFMTTAGACTVKTLKEGAVK